MSFIGNIARALRSFLGEPDSTNLTVEIPSLKVAYLPPFDLAWVINEESPTLPVRVEFLATQIHLLSEAYAKASNATRNLAEAYHEGKLVISDAEGRRCLQLCWTPTGDSVPCIHN